MHLMSHRGSSCLARVIPSMHVHLCVVWWLFSSPVSFSSPFRCSSSRPSRCLPPSSTRSSSPKTCATSAWGPWPVLTTRHSLANLRFSHSTQTTSRMQSRHDRRHDSDPSLALLEVVLQERGEAELSGPYQAPPSWEVYTSFLPFQHERDRATPPSPMELSRSCGVGCFCHCHRQ